MLRASLWHERFAWNSETIAAWNSEPRKSRKCKPPHLVVVIWSGFLFLSLSNLRVLPLVQVSDEREGSAALVSRVSKSRAVVLRADSKSSCTLQASKISTSPALKGLNWLRRLVRGTLNLRRNQARESAVVVLKRFTDGTQALSSASESKLMKGARSWICTF